MQLEMGLEFIGVKISGQEKIDESLCPFSKVKKNRLDSGSMICFSGKL
jgi:hypothetical protein